MNQIINVSKQNSNRINKIYYLLCPVQSCLCWPAVELIRLALVAGLAVVLRKNHLALSMAFREHGFLSPHYYWTYVAQL